MKNGGADAKRRAWRYKLCEKQISGQTIPQVLKSQTGWDWRLKLNDTRKANDGPTLNHQPAMEATKQASGFMTVPKHMWDIMLETVQALTAKQNEMTKQYNEVFQTPQKNNKRVEQQENKWASLSATKTTSVHPTPHANTTVPTIEEHPGRYQAARNTGTQSTPNYYQD